MIKYHWFYIVFWSARLTARLRLNHAGLKSIKFVERWRQIHVLIVLLTCVCTIVFQILNITRNMGLISKVREHMEESKGAGRNLIKQFDSKQLPDRIRYQILRLIDVNETMLKMIGCIAPIIGLIVPITVISLSTINLHSALTAHKEALTWKKIVKPE